MWGVTRCPPTPALPSCTSQHSRWIPQPRPSWHTWKPKDAPVREEPRALGLPLPMAQRGVALGPPKGVQLCSPGLQRSVQLQGRGGWVSGHQQGHPALPLGVTLPPTPHNSTHLTPTVASAPEGHLVGAPGVLEVSVPAHPAARAASLVFFSACYLEPSELAAPASLTSARLESARGVFDVRITGWLYCKC